MGVSDRYCHGATFAVTISAPALSLGFQLSLRQKQPALYSSRERRKEISNCRDVVAYVELNSDECFLSAVECLSMCSKCITDEIRQPQVQMSQHSIGVELDAIRRDAAAECPIFNNTVIDGSASVTSCDGSWRPENSSRQL
jgi:hypothetical protein